MVLPTEVVESVFGFLDLNSLAMAARVSKAWNYIIKHDNVLWKNHFRRMYTPRAYVSPFPIQMGSTGYPAETRGQQWMELTKTRKTVQRRWDTTTPAATYFNGHTDSVYCCQFDEYVEFSFLIS
jgi:F-box and WD-40 domain protein 1/11